jgi:glycosyltransferase involved in cell wall biosynthesis
MRARVWLLSEVYYPEDVAVSHYATGLAEGLASDFEVHVVTSQPTYDRRGERWPAVEVRNGVRVERCQATALDKNVLGYRAINAATFSTSIFVHALAHVRKGDVVLAETSPPSLPFIALAVCRATGAKCMIRTEDVYPDAAVSAGLLPANGIITRTLDLANRKLFQHADAIVVIGRCMAELVRHKTGGHCAPITVIPNWADSDVVKPMEGAENPLRSELRLNDKFVVLLAGNLGRVQGLEILVEAAQGLQRDDDVRFLVVGTGAKEAWLRSQIDQRGLTNIILAGAKPRREQNVFLQAGDIALLTLSKGMMGAGVPSRLYNYMAAGMPIIAATGAGSESALVVREEQIGWVVDPGDGIGLAEVIREAKRSRAHLRELGRTARQAAATNYSRSQIVARHAEAIRSLLGC